MQSYNKLSMLFFFCICACLFGNAYADEIRMKNGDRITGEIIKFENGKLTIKTDYAGVIILSVDVLEKITSEQLLYVSLSDGKTVHGKLSGKPDQKLNVATKGSGDVVVDFKGVKTIRSQSEHMDYLRRTHPSWSDMWNGGLSLGYTLTTGNTETSTLGLGGNLGRNTRRDKTTLYATYATGKKTTDGINETTAYVIRGGWRYQYNLTDRLYAFGFTDFEHNKIQYLDLRIVPGLGLGYYVKKNERTEFDVFAGASLNHENFFCRDGEFINEDARCATSRKIIRNSAEALIGEGLVLKLNDRVLFNERFQFFPNLTDTGEYRITFDSSLQVKLKKWLVWNITGSDRYISNPPVNSKNNDLLLTTGLGIILTDFNFRGWKK